MPIRYDEEKKDLPPEPLRQLFIQVGWSNGLETPRQRALFNIGFLHSTLVVSAWDGERLVGAVRVLSDQVFRSILYDLLVAPAYQGRGIGGELVQRCRAHWPDSEWLVETTPEMAGYYEKLGFRRNADAFLTIPCALFSLDN